MSNIYYYVVKNTILEGTKVYVLLYILDITHLITLYTACISIPHDKGYIFRLSARGIRMVKYIMIWDLFGIGLIVAFNW